MKANPFDSHYDGQVLLALILFSSTVLVQAQAPPNAPLVEYHRPYLKVQITQATNLQTVLESVCRSTGFKCSGLETAVQATVAPIVAEGAVEKVISELLEGAQLDYVVLPASANGQPGQLLVQVRKDLPPPNPSMLATTPAPESVSPAMAEAPPANASSPAMESASTQRESQPSVLTQEGQAGSTEAPDGMVMLPFPNARGNPVYLQKSQESEHIAPFPGPDGRPLVFPAESPSEITLPFPDAQGRPIVVPFDRSRRDATPFFPATVK